MQPLISSESVIDEELLSSHIAKLLFFSIKNQQETYTSKSLAIIENIQKFVLNNTLTSTLRDCTLSFVEEILIHSRPTNEKQQDEFQEKILVTKSHLFEHFAKVFLQWVHNLENINDNLSKIELISSCFTEMLVYHKGNLYFFHHSNSI